MAYQILKQLVSEEGGITSASINGRVVVVARCARCGWGRNRMWTVEQNALTKLAEHMMLRHRIRLALSREDAGGG